MAMAADLHMHTTCSDGEFSPIELYERAALVEGLEFIAITDHDSVSAYSFLAEQELKGPKLIVGVELSCGFNQRGVHMLGLGLDPLNSELVDALEKKRLARQRRIGEVVDKLQALGIELIEEDVRAECASDSTAPGRPHVARAMITKGYVQSIDEAFSRYLGDHSPAYVPSPRFAFDEAVELVHGAGGKFFIAHPGLYFNKPEIVAEMKALGLDGIEVFHPAHANRQVRRWTEAADNLDLLVSGGSDFHSVSWAGKNHGRLGHTGLTRKYLEPLLEAIGN
jgi:predicted metal-dependent phosphoesterase TrpH